MVGKWSVNKEIRVFGIQRSGNHAIINWILKQAPKAAYFLNHGDPLLPLDEYWDYRPPPPQVELFIHSYENKRFSPQLLKIADANRSFFFERPEWSVDLLILRDPFNLFASRFRSGYIKSGRDDRYDQVDLWLYYANEYCGNTNFLGAGKIPISYNRWCRDVDYRKALSTRLQLEFSDAGFSEVTKYGGGSSFDGTRMNGRASDMRTLERWKSLADDPRYRACFDDPRVLSLSEQIFGEIEGTREFVREGTERRRRLRAVARHLYVRHVIMRLIDLRLWYDRKAYIGNAARPLEG